MNAEQPTVTVRQVVVTLLTFLLPPLAFLAAAKLTLPGEPSWGDAAITSLLLSGALLCAAGAALAPRRQLDPDAERSAMMTGAGGGVPAVLMRSMFGYGLAGALALPLLVAGALYGAGDGWAQAAVWVVVLAMPLTCSLAITGRPARLVPQPLRDDGPFSLWSRDERASVRHGAIVAAAPIIFGLAAKLLVPSAPWIQAAIAGWFVALAVGLMKIPPYVRRGASVDPMMVVFALSEYRWLEGTLLRGLVPLSVAGAMASLAGVLMLLDLAPLLVALFGLLALLAAFAATPLMVFGQPRALVPEPYRSDGPHTMWSPLAETFDVDGADHYWLRWVGTTEADAAPLAALDSELQAHEIPAHAEAQATGKAQTAARNSVLDRFGRPR